MPTSTSPPTGALSLASGDVRTPFAVASAVAALLSLYLRSSPGSAGPAPAAAQQGPAVKLACLPVPPPMELVLPARLAALLRLLQYRPAGPAPMLEAAEGAPCR